MKLMIMIDLGENMRIMGDNAQDLYEDIKEVTEYWVYKDPEYIPPSSSQIREVVANLLREKFYVIPGGKKDG